MIIGLAKTQTRVAWNAAAHFPPSLPSGGVESYGVSILSAQYSQVGSNKSKSPG